MEFWSRLCYGQIILTENLLHSNQTDIETQLKGEGLLIEAVTKKGWQHFFDTSAVFTLLGRIDYVGRNFPDSQFPSAGETQIQDYLISSCSGKTSFAELKESVSINAFSQRLLSYQQKIFLDQMAPIRLDLLGRKNVLINYEINKPPWIVSRIQDFYGLRNSPSIGQGRSSLVLHLLAPNQRPVQITSDLAGFWSRHYPQIRRELSRRYPRHAWPENPLQPISKSTKNL